MLLGWLIFLVILILALKLQPLKSLPSRRLKMVIDPNNLPILKPPLDTAPGPKPKPGQILLLGTALFLGLGLDSFGLDGLLTGRTGGFG
jgi:hypothetical protein